jgi:antitoxin VapB
MESIDVPDDFMADRPMNVVPAERDIFGDEE